MVKYKLAMIQGDGVGPEVTRECIRVLKELENVTDVGFEFIGVDAGAECYKRTGRALPDETIRICEKSDGILKAPVGLPDVPLAIVEREVVLGLRRRFDLFANIRPIRLYPSLEDASPLKSERIARGVDFVIVRENTESLYKGHGGVSEDVATDIMLYTEHGVERIVEYAFNLAKSRRGMLTSVDKANILHCSEYWRKKFEDAAKRHPEVKTESMYVDAFSQWLIRDPGRFDVVVVENMFGDIVSDEAGEIVGSLGMLSSANHNSKTEKVMAEPGHGSAPDIAGKGIANPIAMILSAKLMLELYNEKKAAGIIDSAVEKVLGKGYRTKDIASGPKYVGTEDMGREIAEEVGKHEQKSLH